jgi:predicted lipase
MNHQTMGDLQTCLILSVKKFQKIVCSIIKKVTIKMIFSISTSLLVFSRLQIKIGMMLNPAVYWCTNTCSLILNRTRFISNDIYVHTQKFQKIVCSIIKKVTIKMIFSISTSLLVFSRLLNSSTMQCIPVNLSSSITRWTKSSLTNRIRLSEASKDYEFAMNKKFLEVSR